jgi:hypothetical protein
MGETTLKSYRFAIEPDQGIACMENTGTDWVYPASYTQNIVIYDANGIMHSLVMDNRTGHLWDISGREGPADSDQARYWQDMETVGSGDGTDIAPKVTWAEDEGESEHFFMEHLETHLYVRPWDESQRDATGYDSDGFVDDLEFDLDIYENGNPTSKSSITNVPRSGDLFFDRFARAHRLNQKVTANKSQHYIVGRQTYYKASDVADTPANRVSTTGDYQAEFAEPVQWIDLINSSLIDRYSGSATGISGSITAATGPESGSTAWTFSAALTFPSVTLTAGSILIWRTGTIAVTVGGVAVALTDHGTSGSWTLSYATGIAQTGAVVITPTGSPTCFDFRVFNAAISTAARTWYYNDIIDNSGGSSIPR